MKLNLLHSSQVSLAALKNAKGRLNDGGNLALMANAKGKDGYHFWVFRSTFQGTPFEMSLGPLHRVSLSQARELATVARQKLGRGEDPREKRMTERERNAQAAEDRQRAKDGLPVKDSVKDWTMRFIDITKSGWGAQEDTLQNWLSQMEKHVFPVIGDRKIASIERNEITNLLCAIQKNAAEEKAGKAGTAMMHAVRKKLNNVFEYAMLAEHLTRNVIKGQQKLIAKHIGQNNPAVKTAEALNAVLTAFDNCGSGLVVKTAMQVQTYLFQRSDITTEMEWAHVNLARAMWTVPVALMKGDLEEKTTGADHEVPLPRQVVALLTELHKTTGGGRYVFPHAKEANAPMNEDSLNNAMQSAMGRRKNKPWKSYQTAHGFRALGITFGPKYVELYGTPLDKDVLDVIAGHKKGDYLGQAYMRDDYGDRRARYVQAYADWIDAVRAGESWAMLTFTERRAASQEAGIPPGLTAEEWAEVQAKRQAARSALPAAANDFGDARAAA